MPISISSDGPVLHEVQLEGEEMNSSMFVDAMNQLHEKYQENEKIMEEKMKEVKDIKVFLISMFGLLKQMDKIQDNCEFEPNFHFLFESILYGFESKVLEIIS